MAKHFTAYFKSEDDLLSAQASLRTLRTKDMTTDTIASQNNEGFVPYLALNNSITNAGYATVYQNREQDCLFYMLEGQVEEGQYEKATEIIQKNGGFN